MRPCPNAPRACLLASTSCSDVTCEVSSVRFFCALSMTASRSLSLSQDCRPCALVVVSHRLPEPVRHRIEPLVDGVLELRLRLGEELAHLLHEGAELDDALVGCGRRATSAGYEGAARTA